MYTTRQFAAASRRIAPLAVVAVLLVVGCGKAAHEPRPATGAYPVAAIVASLADLARRQQAQIPGALPPGFRNSFTDGFRGWPVTPLHTQHPIRGSFLDPRGQDENGLAGYHFGIDVNVDDRQPESGAGPGLSHRVYAVDGGTALVVHGLRHTCPTGAWRSATSPTGTSHRSSRPAPESNQAS